MAMATVMVMVMAVMAMVMVMVREIGEEIGKGEKPVFVDIQLKPS